MRKTRIIMGMPIVIEIVEGDNRNIEIAFQYFQHVDERYSPYKDTSELAHINRGLARREWSDEMRSVLDLCEDTRRRTNGYFDVQRDGKIDPSGLVKGWAIQNVADLLSSMGCKRFYIEAGGDVQVVGLSASNRPWTLGIRNPFNTDQIVKILDVVDVGIATSGTYIRGEHIYNPHSDGLDDNHLKSLTVIGPNVYEADRFATAAFAMGTAGIMFIERLTGFEAYAIDDRRIATLTSGFEGYVATSV